MRHGTAELISASKDTDRAVARALLVAPDGGHLGLGDKLATRGYHCTLETSIHEPTPAPQGEHPDVIILIGAAANGIKAGPGPGAPVSSPIPNSRSLMWPNRFRWVSAMDRLKSVTATPRNL